MKNIFKIHPFCYIVALIYILIGLFRPFFWITLLILCHEMGHILAGLYFHWKIERVVLMPFGGITIFKESLNRPMKEELWIVIMGPIFQVIFFLLCRPFVAYDWFLHIHVALLIFNLLPIIPLDGSKILHCFFDFHFPFFKSHNLILFISVGGIFLLTLYAFYLGNLLLGIMILCITLKVMEEYKYRRIRMHKFLLERYLHNYSFFRRKKIIGSNVYKMKRDSIHIFFVNGHWYSESYVLKEYFENGRNY